MTLEAHPYPAVADACDDGRGTERELSIRPLRIDEKVNLVSMEGTVSRREEVVLSGRRDMVAVVFVRTGRLSLPAPGAAEEIACGPGSVHMVYRNGAPQAVVLHGGEETSVTVVELPLPYLLELLASACPAALGGADGTPPAFFHREILPSVALLSALYQMDASHVHARLRSLFLASKAYELIALGLERMCTCDRDFGLSAADIERLKRAREILSRNLSNPPSLIELAHEVGVNDFKLKRGFKVLFDTTPFGYVKEQRMMMARRELMKGARSVTVVANQVGYTNLGHFAAAFRKTYGIMPKDVKKVGFGACATGAA